MANTIFSAMTPKIICTTLFALTLFACGNADENVSAHAAPVKERQAVMQTDPNFSAYRPDTSVQISQYIRHIFEDSKGNLWIGTTNQGVALYDGTSLTFAITPYIKNKTVTGFTEDKNGHIWIATGDGVFKYDHKKFTRYDVSKDMRSNEIWSIFTDTDGLVWIGTAEGVFQFKDEKFIPFHIPLPGLKNVSPRTSAKLVWCFLQDKKGHMWFGTDGYGATQYDGKNFTHYTTLQGLCNNNVTGLFEDSKGNIWFGTTEWNKFSEGGVSCYDGKKFTNYSTKNGLSNNHVSRMYESKKGEIWFVMRSNGIDIFDGKTFTNLNKKDGLTATGAMCVMEDKNGMVWVGTGGGLYKYDGQKFINVTKNGPWK